MGVRTNATIAVWQEKSGIRPATGRYAEVLEDISQAAFELIKITELERSGIRDGDGYWHGSGVMQGALNDQINLLKRLREANEEQRLEMVDRRDK
jgi:hypothetical protein